MKQRERETIKEFANRVEKTSHELTHALTIDKSTVETGIIAKTIRAHALSVFISGIPYNIRLIVKARNVSTFEEAVLIAVEEERSFEKPEKKWDREKFDKNKYERNRFDKNKYERNRFDKNKFERKRNTNNKSDIKCYRCNKFGHYSNECRTSMNTNFRSINTNFNRETRPEIKRENEGSQIKFCQYCKKYNHTISECRQRKYNEEKKKELGESSGTQNRSIGEIKNNAIRIITHLDKEHVTCFSHNFEPNALKFLIDSGADMCVVKLSSLNDQIIVNEQQKRSIKGITALSVDTYGTIMVTMTINGIDFVTKFDVVDDNFPVPEAGILGRDFIKKHKIVIDLSQELIVIPELKPTVTEQIILPPRSNCVLLIKKDEVVDHGTITIKNQEINDDVIIANSISPVIGDKVVSNIINISEQPFIIENLTTSNLQWEAYQENNRVMLTASGSEGSNRIKKIHDAIKTEHLNTEERECLLELCSSYSDLFFFDGDYLTATDIVTHSINTPRLTKPINIRPYRLPWAYQEEIERQIKEMKDNNVIRNSVSPFNFPLVVVKKKNTDPDGKPKLRICVDFRKLNEITENEAYGLPNIIEILDSLGSSKYFSTLDLASGYHQIKINEVDIHKTAFSSKSGHYEFLRMPFGLSSAPATFTRAMKAVLIGLDEFCTAYLDDIVVHGSSLLDHQIKLEKVFERLRKNNLKLQPNKCAFLRKEVLYLGHVINEKGISPDPNKLECIKNYPRPKNTKDIKSFLGLLNYYRRFVDNFAKIAKPLTALLKKNVPYNWTDKSEDAFQILKEKLMNPPLLTYPDWEKGNFNLMTDASQYAIGAVLSQGQIPEDQPIAYASRTLNKAEVNYSVIQKELLAIVWGVKHFRPYLYGRKFTIVTDHRPLTYLFGIKDVSSQLMRYRLQLSEYDYTITYRSGPEHSNADCLSRICIISEVEDRYKQFLEAERKPIINLKITECEDSITTAGEDEIKILPVSNDKIITHTAIREIMEKNNVATIEFGDGLNFYKLNETIIFYKFRETHTTELTPIDFFNNIFEIKQYTVENKINEFSTIRMEGTNTLTSFERIRIMLRYVFKDINVKVKIYREQKLTEEEKMQLIAEYHDSPIGGHSGISRTIKRVKLNYNWKNLKKDVKRYIRNCDICQKTKTHKKTKQPMLITSTVTRPFERICMDIVGPLPTTITGNAYILTTQDELTRYATATALTITTADAVAQSFVECFVCIYGIPDSILTDCGTNFLSEVFKNMCRLLGIDKSKTTPWHPQTNGFLERSHKTLKSYLRSFIDRDSNWDTWLCYAMFCYNTTVHTSTEFTPYELVFGHKPNIPTAFLRNPEPQYNYDNYIADLKRIMQETHKIARENLIQKKENNKKYYDETKNPIDIHVGDKVLIREQNKKHPLSLNWKGPFEVLLVHDNENVTVKKGRKDYRIHINNIKKYYN